MNFGYSITGLKWLNLARKKKIVEDHLAVTLVGIMGCRDMFSAYQ